MESAFLKIRITTDDEMNVRELCKPAVSWAYIQEGSLEWFLPGPVNFHIYLETYLKPQNVRDLIRRKVGNGKESSSLLELHEHAPAIHLDLPLQSAILQGCIQCHHKAG